MIDHFTEGIPKFYGSVTVGERGQVAIPVEARREMTIEPAAKLLAFGSRDRRVLILMKAESAVELLASASAALHEFERLLQVGSAAETG